MLIVGSVAPVALRLTVTRLAASTLDLRTVTAATLRVRLPPNDFGEYETTTWSLTLGASTTSTLVMTHTFASGELATDGVYRISADLTVPGGTVPCEARDLIVSPRF